MGYERPPIAHFQVPGSVGAGRRRRALTPEAFRTRHDRARGTSPGPRRFRGGTAEGRRALAVDGGSAKILDKILGDQRSFGLAGREVVDREDLDTDKRLRIIAPLYDEKLHILYRKKKYEAIWKEEGREGRPEPPVFKLGLDPVTRRFFEEAKVSAGSGKPKKGKFNLALRMMKLCDLSPAEVGYDSIQDTIEGMAEESNSTPHSIALIVVMGDENGRRLAHLGSRADLEGIRADLEEMTTNGGPEYSRVESRDFVREVLGSHMELATNHRLPMPRIDEDHKGIVEKITVGISKLLELASDIRDDYDTGGITPSHRENLVGSL